WFRHSCFTQLASRGARLESIQALAGHANIQTTMHYNEAAQLMSPASAIFDEE
ncbi:MAG: site-specific integrase, partial [Bilophila sp.]|nr:site-specific integrase [Bilophila sp.]